MPAKLNCKVGDVPLVIVLEPVREESMTEGGELVPDQIVLPASFTLIRLPMDAGQVRNMLERVIVVPEVY